MDMVVKEELANMHVRIPGFYERFFGCVADLEPASDIFYKKCEVMNNKGDWEGGVFWRSGFLLLSFFL